MSLILIEGWDSLSAINRKYAYSGSPSLDPTIKRHGTHSLKTLGSTSYVTLSLDGTYSVAYIGFSLYPITFAAIGTSASCMVQFIRNISVQCGVGITSTGKIVVYNLSSLIGESTKLLTPTTWCYIEIKATISNSISLNDFQVKVNGEIWINLPATTDTQASATVDMDSIRLSGNALLNGGVYFDDIYVLNTSGSKNNTFLGDVKVLTLYPDGNGNANDFDGSDGNQVDNYLLVDEAQDNADTDYVESLTVSEKDQYTFDDISDTPETIYGVSGRAIVKKSDAGSRTGKLLCRSGGADYEGDEFFPGTDYGAFDRIWEDDPDTATDWLKAGVGSAEFGVKVET